MMEGCEDARDLQATQKNSEKTLFENPAQFISDLTRVTSRGSVRFGTLSHHSFFSRHNPHPHRVTHLSGLNGSPVCTVNDDWFSNTPLFPHPFIKSQVLDSGTRTHPLNYSSTSGAQSSRALLSDAWQEELKDLATKISLSAAGSGPGQRDKGQGSQEEEPSQRKTQYSSETGRIIPPSSCRNKHHSTATSHRRPATHRLQTDSLGGQELRVLELLCQILQTDSLSLVQQWLLLAGDRVLPEVDQCVVVNPSDSDQTSAHGEVMFLPGVFSAWTMCVPLRSVQPLANVNTVGLLSQNWGSQLILNCVSCRAIDYMFRLWERESCCSSVSGSRGTVSPTAPSLEVQEPRREASPAHEKEMVMSLLQQAMMDSTLTDHQQLPFTSETLISSTAQSRRKRRLKSLSSAQEALDETPVRIGEAEVLQVHLEEGGSVNEDPAPQREHSH